MRVHLINLPNVQSTQAYDLDGFNLLNRRFARLLKELGHTVILYSSDENDFPCDEHVSCIRKADIDKSFIGGEYQHAFIDQTNPVWQLANPVMAAEIGKRKQPRDLICTLGGGSQKPITDAHPDLMAVEYSIGYVGNYAPYRVFQSKAWQHTCYGQQGIDSGRFFDAVIPAFFETEKFPERTTEDYVLYVGRFVPKKGVSIVCDAAKAAGVPLKLIGHGAKELITYGEYLGPLHEADKIEAMARAKALICPTLYVEPFGCISPEAQLCGTPVIATDFGGFTETVEHGVTGYRCNLFGEFVDAIGKVGSLDRTYIRDRAQDLYGLETAKRSYAQYFDRLNTLWDKGWHTPIREVA